jgi:hypothetical protein
MITTSRFFPLFLLTLAACAAPGTDIEPGADDFAFLDIQLRG